MWNHIESTPGILECYFWSIHLQTGKMELEKIQRKSMGMIQGTGN